MALSVSYPLAFTNLANYYSQDPGATLADNMHFALYYQGTLVSEVKSGGAADPNTGCPPGNVTLTDPIPADVTFVSGSPGAVLGGGAVTWSDSCFPGQGNLSASWVGQVAATAYGGEVLPNRATLANLGPSGLLPAISNYVYTTVTATTPTLSATPTMSPSATATATSSSSPTPSASPTATASASPTPTDTQSATLTASPSPSDTATATPSATQSETPSASPTVTATPTATTSATQSETPSFSPTVTATPTASATSPASAWR